MKRHRTEPKSRSSGSGTRSRSRTKQQPTHSHPHTQATRSEPPTLRLTGHNSISVVFFHQFFVGLLFVILGISGFAGLQEGTRLIVSMVGDLMGERAAAWVDILIPLCELMGGIVVLSTLFTRVSRVILDWVLLAVMILWFLRFLLLDIILPEFGTPGFSWMPWVERTLTHLIFLITLFRFRRGD